MTEKPSAAAYKPVDDHARCRRCGTTFTEIVPTRCPSCGYTADEHPGGDMTTTDETTTGLLHKYDVKRVNDTEGKHDDCRYFVLDPQHDPLAREALGAYANAAAVAGYRALAVDLNRWLGDCS